LATTMMVRGNETGEPESSDYIEFPHLPGDATNDGKLVLNRHSTFITHGHDFPPAKVCMAANYLHLPVRHLLINARPCCTEQESRTKSRCKPARMSE
jgi:hypothetical protein